MQLSCPKCAHNKQICLSGRCSVPLVVSVVHREHERKLAGTQVIVSGCECMRDLQWCPFAARAASGFVSGKEKERK